MSPTAVRLSVVVVALGTLAGAFRLVRASTDNPSPASAVSEADLDKSNPVQPLPAKLLGHESALADLPIIVVSGIDAEPLARHFAGIVAHFAKPIAVPDLLAAIRKHCPPK